MCFSHFVNIQGTHTRETSPQIKEIFAEGKRISFVFFSLSMKEAKTEIARVPALTAKKFARISRSGKELMGNTFSLSRLRTKMIFVKRANDSEINQPFREKHRGINYTHMFYIIPCATQEVN